MKTKIKTKKRNGKFSKRIYNRKKSNRKTKKIRGGGGCMSGMCMPPPPPEPIPEPQPVPPLLTPLEKDAAIKIARNLPKTREEYKQRKVNYLNMICSDSNVCISFGKQTDMIKSLFDGFTNFDYSNKNLKLLNSGANGFVYEMEYKKNGYIAHVAFKSYIYNAIDAELASDNLAYEYLVGKYINSIAQKHTCFLETYGLFKYINENAYIFFKNEGDNIPGKTLNNQITRMSETDTQFYNNICEHYKHLCILTQYVKGKTLGYYLWDMVASPEFPDIFKYDLLYILYQIYMPLSQLINKFTHYDLHQDNVMLYKPSEDGYLEYHYHLPDNKTTIFRSQYLVKLLDYGRSYYNEGANNNSSVVYDKICHTITCNPQCGVDKGFARLGIDRQRKHRVKAVNLISRKPNKSYDLWLLDTIQGLILSHRDLDLLKDVEGLDLLCYMIEFDNGIEKESEVMKINNVLDAFKSLNDIVNTESNITKNRERYSDVKKKIGELHIYTDGRDVEYKANIPTAPNPSARPGSYDDDEKEWSVSELMFE